MLLIPAPFFQQIKFLATEAFAQLLIKGTQKLPIMR